MYKIYNIGILGYGHIGRGVNKIINELSLRQPLQVKKIFDIPSKSKEIGEKFVSSIDDIIDDNNIDIVVEALGGDTFPFECIKQALKAKKHVVTSNKEVVAHHLKELLTLAHENGVYFQFEASVCSGIPLLRPLIELTKVDEILACQGILSSTTNFILTRMQDDKISLKEAIKLAQSYNITEKDYQRDMLGEDMVDKISIISSLAYLTPINPDDVYRHGIETISDEIIQDINSRGLYLKFIAISKKVNDKIEIGVAPVLVPSSHHLVSIKDIYNEVRMDLKNSDRIHFSGMGGGELPASSAIASDIVRIIENSAYINNVDLHHYELIPFEVNDSSYYIFDEGKGKIVKSKQDVLKIKPYFYSRILN